MCGEPWLFPPTLDGMNYAMWKTHMKLYIKGKKHSLWIAIVEGFKKKSKYSTSQESEVERLRK